MTNIESIIQLRNISKTYQLAQQKVEALRDVSLNIRKGQVVICNRAVGFRKKYPAACDGDTR